MSENAPQTGAITQTEPETQFDELDVDTPLVGIIMGSKSDMPEMEKAGEILSEKGIHFEVRVMSAHRDPDTVADYCRNARMRGLKVIIAGAGLSAALPGVAAAHSDLPVIGVPLSSRLSAMGGLDAGTVDDQTPDPARGTRHEHGAPPRARHGAICRSPDRLPPPARARRFSLPLSISSSPPP